MVVHGELEDGLGRFVWFEVRQGIGAYQGASLAPAVSHRNPEPSATGLEPSRMVEERFPSVRIFTPVIDQGLNDRKFIVPGLGDFGDRLYGTI